MTSDEIREMFRAGALLKHLPLIDKQRPALETAYEKLSRQYEAECLAPQGEAFSPASENGSRTPICDAIGEICKTCQAASQLELAYKPNKMTDEDVMALAAVRQNALDILVDALASKIQAEQKHLSN